MISAITLALFILSSILGKYIFKRWFNPIFMYTGSWTFMLLIYDLNWINYSRMYMQTWYIVIMAYVSFILGVVALYTAKSALNENSLVLKPGGTKRLHIFYKDGKIVKYIVFVSAIIGIGASIQHWYVLIKEFGSITNVFLQAGEIYKMRVEGEHLGKIPYLTSFSYIGVFLSSVYSAYKNKLSMLLVLPFIGVVLGEAANLSRAGVFFAFVLFGIVLITTKYFISLNTKEKKSNAKFVVSLFLIVFIAIASVTVIRIIRNPFGDFKAQTSEMSEFKDNLIISPSLYLYFSSPIVVLDKYFTRMDEHNYIGENTFFPVYNFLKRFRWVEGLNSYPRGYFVPMWTNSSTFIRELHADFGWSGIFIVPFLTGFFSAFFYFRFFNSGRLSDLVLYSFFSSITVFSVFYIASRLTLWYIGLFGLLGISLLERRFARKEREEKISIKLEA